MADATVHSSTTTVAVKHLQEDGRDYPIWKKSMVNYLASRGMADMLTTPIPLVSDGDNDEKKVATQRQGVKAQVAYHTIWSALSDELKREYISVDDGDAYELWRLIVKKYESKTEASKKILNKQLDECYMRSDERFDTYKSRLVYIIGQLRATGEAVTDERKIDRLLLGLTDAYSSTAQTLSINIKANNMDFDDACEHIRNYEEMMNIKNDKHDDLESRLASDSASSYYVNQERAFYTNQGYRGRGVQRGGASRYEQGGSYRDRGNRTCYTCNEPGHVAFDCEKNKNKKKCTYCRTIGSHTTGECYSKDRDRHTGNNGGRHDDREYEHEEHSHLVLHAGVDTEPFHM
jgi:hypothetical protein